MSEYTFTTEEMSKVYGQWMLQRHGTKLEMGEFDRWLTQHDKEVAEAERDRIIGILENIPAGSGVMGGVVSLAIEIIKREN